MMRVGTILVIAGERVLVATRGNDLSPLARGEHHKARLQIHLNKCIVEVWRGQMFACWCKCL
jgi:hypothetical protein